MGIKRCEALRQARIAYSESRKRRQMIKLQQIIEGKYLEEEKKLIE